MSPYPTLTPQVIGQAEKTLNAILDRLLAGPGLTEAQWITLTLTAAGAGAGGRGQLVTQVAHGLKIDEARARAHLDSLAARGLVRDSGDARLLRQAYVARQGHCAFTPNEVLAGLHAVEHRVDTGRWGDTSAAALGSGQPAGSTAFVDFRPARLVDGDYRR